MDALAAGGSAIEVELGGRILKFAPLTLGDLADFEGWAAGLYISEALRLSDQMSATDRIQIVRAAWDDAQPRAATMMSSLRGVCRLLWLSLRHEQPDITIAEVGDVVTTANLPAMNALIEALSGGRPEEGDEERPPEEAVAGLRSS